MSRLHPLHPTTLLLVALGGALGACTRAWLSSVFPDAGTGFPWTTFAINVAGSFLLALLPVSSLVRRHHLLPPMLGTGVLGGFTTLSTYSDQTRQLLADGAAGVATAYVLGTLTACLAVVALADHFSTLAARAEFEDEEGDF